MTSKSKPPRTHVAHGRITWNGGHPAQGVVVCVMDVDHLDRALALARRTTDARGRFRIPYGLEAFRTRHGRSPVLCLRVYDGAGRLMNTTRAALDPDTGLRERFHVHLPEDGPAPPDARASLAKAAAAGLWDELDAAGVAEIAREIFAPTNPAPAVGGVPGERGAAPRRCAVPNLHFFERLGVTHGKHRKLALDFHDTATADSILKDARPHSFPPFDIYSGLGKDPPLPPGRPGAILMPGTAEQVGTVADDGTPEYVQRLAFWLRFALERFREPPFGFRLPKGTIRVLITKEVSYGSARNGLILLNPGFEPDELAAAAVHELMHLIQERYQTNGVSGEWYLGMEGGAVLAEDMVLDGVNRWVEEANQADGTLSAPHSCLHESGYKQALFLKYLTEQQSRNVLPEHEPAIGVDAYRALLESFDRLGHGTEAVEAVVRDLVWQQTFVDFEYADSARLDRTCSETLLGNFWLACYLKDFHTTVGDRRFTFMEHGATASGKGSALRRVTLSENARLTSMPVTNQASVQRFAARYHRFKVAPDVDTFQVRFSAADFQAPQVQLVLMELGGRVRDVLRFDAREWSRTIASMRGETRLDHVVAIVAGTRSGGGYTLVADRADPAPDVMVTRWHHRVGTHYEIDSFGGAWTWLSPDLWVDTDGDGAPDGQVVAGRDNRLFVRLHNQGNVAAAGIEVEFSYQPAGGAPRENAWVPVRDAGGAAQVLTGLELGAQSSGQWSVDWAPAAPAGTSAFSVRAVVRVPGDPNTDNKRCISNVGAAAASGDADFMLEPSAPPEAEDAVEMMVLPRVQGRVSTNPIGPELPDDPAAGRKGAQKRRQRGRRRAPIGRPGEHHPTDPRALPPGMEDADLVTVAWLVRGKLAGGFTRAIRGGRTDAGTAAHGSPGGAKASSTGDEHAGAPRVRDGGEPGAGPSADQGPQIRKARTKSSKRSGRNR